ncbi:thioredoxin [Bellilinea caldifistulae]|uniref:Thioredoxin family protein n=1 Tax=Bellilinea caldifistulae TaxID=360411 RepID=A0A0P6Y6A0_9CHLR|nr:thioredoxin family protein [Bellilinea caldifistulae]KPL77104.1 hypothetical protein AC812_03755 [Bellilinea caldifistulae]GAP10051.1 thioredoxin [Bellilinea caldifistulae]
MSNFPIDRETWQKGLTVEEFVESMTQHQEPMRRRLEQVRLQPQEIAQIQKLDRRLYLAVMTEDWCSDCLMVLPILVKLAQASGKIEVKVFIRREWPALRSFYQSQDIPSIPVATFLDDQFQPLVTWIERPRAAHHRLAEWKLAHPEVEQIRRRADLSSEEKRQLLKEVLDQLLVEMEEWYAEELQSETVREILELLGLESVGSGI